MGLLKQQFKAEWLSLLIWSAVLFVLIFFSVTMWTMLRDSGALAEVEVLFTQLPEAMRVAYGISDELTTITGWLQSYGFGAWLAMIYVVYTAIFVAGIVTREVDRRTMEFLLSLPVARWQVILNRWIGFALSLGVLHLVHFAAIVAGVAATGHSPETGVYALAILNSWLLYLALGSLLLVVSMYLDEYPRGVGLTVGLGFALYFLHVGTTSATGWLADLREVLPFALYKANDILSGEAVPTADFLILGGMAAMGLGLSVVIFQRKQLSM